MPNMTLKVGDLAYFDTFAGMITCRVMSITGTSGHPSTGQTVKAQLTAERGAWKPGEVIETSGLHVCPRPAYRRTRGTIKPYLVEVANA